MALLSLTSKSDFPKLVREVCNLLSVNNYNKSKVNSLIDELNALDYKSGLFVEVIDGTTLITALCQNIEPKDAALAAKVVYLIRGLLMKQNLHLSDSLIKIIIEWNILCCNNCDEIVLPDFIQNLQTLLHFWPQVAMIFAEDLVGNEGVLLKLLNQNKRKTLKALDDVSDMTLLALKCICSLTLTPEDNKSPQSSLDQNYNEKICDAILKLLYEKTSKSDEPKYCKMVVYALKILSQLYLQNPGMLKPCLSEVMGVCIHFVLYGLLVVGSLPHKVSPSQQSIAIPVAPTPSLSGKKHKIRKHRNKAVEGLKKENVITEQSLTKLEPLDKSYTPALQTFFDIPKSKQVWAMTSDSDVSDAENSREAKLVALKAKVRQGASNLLLVVIKVSEKKDLYGYWWALLPDSPNADSWSSEEQCKRTLAYSVVTDPIAANRSAVLSVILSLLTGSRMLLAHAEASKKGITSFIPFSVTLGHSIKCLHGALVSIVECERAPSVAVVALKCCAALVQATPYHKLEPGLILDLVKACRKFLVHREITLQVAALITMGCIISVDPKVDEILKSVEKEESTTNQYNSCAESKISNDFDDYEECFSDEDFFGVSETERSSDKKIYFRSWIIDICFRNLGYVLKDSEIKKCLPSAIPLMLESLQVLSAVAIHHFVLIEDHVTLTCNVLSELLTHDHQEMVFQAARTVSSVGEALQKIGAEEPTPCMRERVHFWEALLSGPLPAVFGDFHNASAKAVACDCIANVGEDAFTLLPRRLQALCCALLTGSCADESAPVRASAVRASALLLMHKPLREDLSFLSACGENILRALEDEVLAVKTKAAWALGNYSDALVLNMDDPDIDSTEDFRMLLKLLEVSVQCAKENDKLKTSATRALGNLLRLVDDRFLKWDARAKVVTELAIRTLVSCAHKVSNMKVRWNSCYALGNAMKNDVLFGSLTGWQREVFNGLCTLVVDCKNIKVRINAAVALRAPRTRRHYAGHFAEAWRAVMAGMDSANNIHDFSEYQHKDNLMEQLCVTLSHLCCLLSASDLESITDAVCLHYETAKGVFEHLHSRLPPENPSCAKVLEAAKYVTINLTSDDDCQKTTLAMLQDLFIWDIS